MTDTLVGWSFGEYGAGKHDPAWIRSAWTSNQWVSDAVSVPPTRRLLVSWIPTPGNPRQVEIDVAPRFDDRWSDWITAATWPEPSKGESPDPRVSIDVDIIHLAEESDAIRVRCRTTSGSGNPPLGALVIACDSRTDAPNEDPAPQLKPFVQDVPFRSQFDAPELFAHRICGPTSLAMQLEAHGELVDTVRVAEEAYDGAHNIYGNWSRIAAVAGMHGLVAWVRSSLSLPELEIHLTHGYGAIVSVAYERDDLDGAPLERTSGHLLVIRGWDTDGNLICNDPAFRTRKGEGIVYDRRQFEKVWTGHDGTAILMRTA